MIKEEVISDFSEENTTGRIVFGVNGLSEHFINLKLNIRVEYVNTVVYKKFLWFSFNKRVFENDFMRVGVTAYFDFNGYPSFHYLVFNNCLDYEQNKKIAFKLPQQRFYTCLVVNYPNEITEKAAVDMAINEIISVAKDYIRSRGKEQGFEISV